MSDQNSDLRQIADEVTSELKGEEGVAAVWLYGAVQRDRTWAESDVDLLVLMDDTPPLPETRLQRRGVPVHLHWIGRAAFDEQIQAKGDPILHGRVGSGELLYDRDDKLASLTEEVRGISEEYRFYQMVPHLNALLDWARDLRKRMALHDERPRRAAARQWEVDNHSASVLLIEKGLYPHNEASTQAMDARIFVPNMTDPSEIDEFVTPRIQERVLPKLRQWADEDGPFDAASLHARYGVGETSRLLEFAARQGWLTPVDESRPGIALKEQRYRPSEA